MIVKRKRLRGRRPIRAGGSFVYSEDQCRRPSQVVRAKQRKCSHLFKSHSFGSNDIRNSSA